MIPTLESKVWLPAILRTMQSIKIMMIFLSFIPLRNWLFKNKIFSITELASSKKAIPSKIIYLQKKIIV